MFRQELPSIVMSEVVIEKKIQDVTKGANLFNAYEASEEKSVSSKSKYQGLNLIFDEPRHRSAPNSSFQC